MVSCAPHYLAVDEAEDDFENEKRRRVRIGMITEPTLRARSHFPGRRPDSGEHFLCT